MSGPNTAPSVNLHHDNWTNGRPHHQWTLSHLVPTTWGDQWPHCSGRWDASMAREQCSGHMSGAWWHTQEEEDDNGLLTRSQHRGLIIQWHHLVHHVTFPILRKLLPHSSRSRNISPLMETITTQSQISPVYIIYLYHIVVYAQLQRCPMFINYSILSISLVIYAQAS